LPPTSGAQWSDRSVDLQKPPALVHPPVADADNPGNDQAARAWPLSISSFISSTESTSNELK
jgi:hypothetical protein